METTLAVYEAVVRKVLAAVGEARTVAREFVAVVAAAADGRLMVKVSCTEAETTSKVTAKGGTPASVATLAISSVRTVGVKSETVPETTTVVERVAAVGGRGVGGGEGDGGGVGGGEGSGEGNAGCGGPGGGDGGAGGGDSGGGLGGGGDGGGAGGDGGDGGGGGGCSGGIAGGIGGLAGGGGDGGGESRTHPPLSIVASESKLIASTIMHPYTSKVHSAAAI